MNKILEKSFVIIFSIVIMSIFLGGTLFAVIQLKEDMAITEICFWASLALLFVSQINRGMLSVFAKLGDSEK